MAGAGGGPPRKSHTKSRNGCQTCKKRHIRCDETFPQCRNCTKHNCRCAYMDLVVAPEETTVKPRKSPDLLMSPEIEVEIENWHLTGVPPFPELLHCPRGGWVGLSRVDLRLIHHIIGLSIDLHRRGLSNCTIWAPKMPNFLALGLTHAFVMSSILALSASQLAWMTQNKETQQLAVRHKAVALTGLQEALNVFSRDNCDAVLAAAILLSWQATEWSNWASLQRDLSSVLDAMHPVWKQESDLAKYLESEKAISSPFSPTNSSFSLCDEEVAQLDQTITALENMGQRVSHNKEHSQRLKELVRLLNELRENLHTHSPEEAFKRAVPLRTWLLWLPSAMLSGGDSDISALAILAQLYGASVTLDSIHPDMGGAFFGPLSVGPVDDIYRIILERRSIDGFNTEFQMALALTDTPQHIVTRYKHRFAWSSRPSVGQYSPAPSSHYTPDPPSPFNGVAVSDCPVAFSDSSSSSCSSASPVPLATYASPLPSPPLTSPFPLAGSYATPPLTEIALYSPSPQLLSENGSDLVDGFEMGNSTIAYTAAYMDGMLYGGGIRSDPTTMEFPLGIYSEPYPFSSTGLPTQEVCWT